MVGKALNNASLVAQTVKYLPGMQETWIRSLGREDPWRRKWQPTSVLLPGKSHRQRSLVPYSPQGCKESDTTERLNRTELWCCMGSLVAQRVKRLPAMRESQVRPLGWEDPLEKEMATHFSTLAWKIPWTEEPGRLQSMGLQRVGHD